MKTYASLAEADYKVQQTHDDEPFPCCGSCKYLNTEGNAITCSRVEGSPRVVPQGICKLFSLSDRSIIGDIEPKETGEEDAE
jgi:hypothetical protein